jgi:hypothetical protein
MTRAGIKLLNVGYIKKRHACVQGILPGLREDVAVCADCDTAYPCDARLLADFIEEIVPDLQKIAEGKVVGKDTVGVAKKILAQIHL